MSPEPGAADPRRNSILRALPADEYGRLERHLEPVDAFVKQSVYEAGGPIDCIYFPLTSVYSQVALADGDRIVIEVNTVGSEGMVGLPVFLGAATSPNAAFCQVPGDAVRLSARALHEVLRHDGALHRQLNRYTQATLVFMAQSVACLGAHSIEQRACRWLLMTHDRVQRDDFELTQEFLGQMLAVRRETVSDIASRLQRQDLIRYSRGRVQIVDRPGLMSMTCDCYRIVREEFDRLLPGE